MPSLEDALTMLADPLSFSRQIPGASGALNDLGRRWDSLGQRALYHPGPNPSAEAMAGREIRQESSRRREELPAWKRLLTHGPMSMSGGPTLTRPLVSEEERAQMLYQARQRVEARDLARNPPAQLFQTAQEADRAEIEALVNKARGGGRLPDPDPYTREDRRRTGMRGVIEHTRPERPSPQTAHSWSFEDALRGGARQPPSQRRAVEEGRVQGRGGMSLQEQLEMDEIARDAEYQWWDNAPRSRRFGAP
jgi:hypothetical protein